MLSAICYPSSLSATPVTLCCGAKLARGSKTHPARACMASQGSRHLRILPSRLMASRGSRHTLPSRRYGHVRRDAALFWATLFCVHSALVYQVLLPPPSSSSHPHALF